MERFQGFIIVVIMVLLGMYLVVSFLDFQETRDAETVETVQVQLQAAVSKGMAALELPPNRINSLNIINSARSTFPKNAVVDRDYKLTLKSSPRGAQFEVTPAGDVLILSINNFTRFHVENGRIIRNNRWLWALP